MNVNASALRSLILFANPVANPFPHAWAGNRPILPWSRRMGRPRGQRLRGGGSGGSGASCRHRQGCLRPGAQSVFRRWFRAEGGPRGILWPFREGFVGPPRPPRATGSSRKDRRPPRARGTRPRGASDLSPNTAFVTSTPGEGPTLRRLPITSPASAGGGGANSSFSPCGRRWQAKPDG